MIKVAIIDDELEVLTMLERLISREKNVEVRVFSNPLNAIDEIKAGVFDLIFLDIVMSQIDGLVLLKEIRANTTKTKVIMMTAHSNLNRVLESHQIGANDFLIKPFKNLKDISDKLPSYLKGCE
jgi:DNA-binding NtrC family response regulator